MQAGVVDVHFTDLGAFQVSWVVDDLLGVALSDSSLAELFLGEELALLSEDPELVVLEADLLVHGLGRWVTKGHILHSERAIQTHLFRGEPVLVLDDDVGGAQTG